MSPRDLSVDSITSRLALLRELLGALELIGEPTAAELRSDVVRRLALERLLTQLVDTAVSINHHVVTTVGSSLPTDKRSTFDEAARVGLISNELSGQLKPGVGMRNVLTHEYLSVDLDMVSAAAPAAAAQYAEYVRQVARWVRDRPAS